MLRNIGYAIIALIGICLVVFSGYGLMMMSAFGLFDKDYSVSELKENFEGKKIEIYELKRFFNEIVPNNRVVEIEFEDDRTLARFGIRGMDSAEFDSTNSAFLEWNLETDTERMDSIVKPLGWTRETLGQIKEKLDQANCIQIESGEPTKIGFQRSGMGMYFFNVFDEPISSKLKPKYNDGCTYILVNNRLALEYGSGAMGPQCFYNKE